MAVVILSNAFDELEDPFQNGSKILANSYSSYWPYPIQGSVRASYRQKCRDTVTGLWTEWVSNYVDTNGALYPGAGFNTGTYRLIGITYDRESV